MAKNRPQKESKLLSLDMALATGLAAGLIIVIFQAAIEIFNIQPLHTILLAIFIYILLLLYAYLKTKNMSTSDYQQELSEQNTQTVQAIAITKSSSSSGVDAIAIAQIKSSDTK